MVVVGGIQREPRHCEAMCDVLYETSVRGVHRRDVAPRRST